MYLTFLGEKVSGITGWFKRLNLESDLDVHDSSLLFYPPWSSGKHEREDYDTKSGSGLKKVFHLHLFSHLNG